MLELWLQVHDKPLSLIYYPNLYQHIKLVLPNNEIYKNEKWYTPNRHGNFTWEYGINSEKVVIFWKGEMLITLTPHYNQIHGGSDSEWLDEWKQFVKNISGLVYNELIKNI